MNKVFATLMLLGISTLGVAAQTLKVSDFHQDPSDLTARAKQELDLNGTPCGLIKVSLSVPDAKFEGDIIKQSDEGKSEYWVYMIDGASYINIKTDDYPVLRYDFPENIKSNCTYVMDVIRPGENPAKRTITLRYDDGTGSELTYKVPMVLARAGRFEMGGTMEQASDMKDETPHWVRITRDFYIGETEVTQELWDFVMGADRNYSLIKGAKHPVDNISWNDAQEFIEAINQMLVGVGKFRLPTEAEWEYAARGAHKMRRTKYSGSDILDEVAWTYANSPEGHHTVGGRKPNEIGAYDMTGNVTELCQDFKADFKSKELTDPQGPDTGKNRTKRGGSYDCKKDDEYRISYRRRAIPEERHPSTDLRIVWQR